MALAEEEEAVDILRLSGATAVLRKSCDLHAVDRRRTALASLTHHVDKVFVGDAADAADRRVLERAGTRTGLSVVALQGGDDLTTPLTALTVLPEGADLVMLGSADQRVAFTKAFGES